MNVQYSVAALIAELKNQGIRDQSVLDAIATVPREKFVPPESRDRVYHNIALPIGCDQTISQPYIVAAMTEALQLTPSSVVLEIGTGSGYQTSVLASLAREVVTIERLEELLLEAKNTLAELGLNNIRYIRGDGSVGCKELAPYDGIIVTAAMPSVPEKLVDQLRVGGRLVAPVGCLQSQVLTVIENGPAGIVSSEICDCRFVKLIGTAGWDN